MKKFVLAFTAAAAILLASCGAKKDANGWYEDFEAAQKVAESSNKNIILFVNSYMDAENTETGVKFLLENPDFTKAVKNDFVCVHFDFTDIVKAMSEVQEGATNKEQKAAEKKREKIVKQSRVADFLAIEETPVAVILTKEGYYVTEAGFDYITDSVDGYVSSLKLEEAAIKEANALVAATKKGSKIDRVHAIDNLYESMSETQRLMMTDLIKKVPSLDPKNTTGLVGKFLISATHADAYEYLVKNDVEKAILVYKKSAVKKGLAPEDSQTLYMVAANILASSRAGSFESVIELLQSALDVAPESPYAGYIQELISSLNQAKEKESDGNSAE